MIFKIYAALMGLGAGLAVVTLGNFLRRHDQRPADDAWEHHLLERYVVTNRQLPDKIAEYFPCNAYYYPPAAYYMGGFFLRHHRSSSDVICILVGVYVGCITGVVFAWHHSVVAAILGSLMVASSLLAEDLRYVNPRVLGTMLVEGALTLVCFCQSWYCLILVGGILTVVAYTHRMSSQSSWLLLAGLSIVRRDPAYLAVAIFAEMSAFLCAPHLYKAIRSGHFAILRSYRIGFEERKDEPRLNILRNMARLFSIGAPDLILLGYLGFHSKYVVMSDWNHNCFALLAVAILLAFLTSVVRPCLFLGEGERYLGYVTLPAALLVVQLFVALTGATGRVVAIMTVIGQVFCCGVRIVRSRVTDKQPCTPETIHQAAMMLREVMSGQSFGGAGEVTNAGTGASDVRIICLPYFLNRRVAFEGLTCFQLTPLAILTIPSLVSGFPFRTFKGSDLRGNIVVQLMSALHIAYCLVYLPSSDLPSGTTCVLREGDWAICRIAATSQKGSEDSSRVAELSDGGVVWKQSNDL